MLREGAPQRISVEGAIATPTVYHRNPRRLSGCLYDEGGRKIALSERVGGIAGDKVPTENPESIDLPSGLPEVPGRLLYLGHFMSKHYGHFLLEGLSSAWAVAEVGEVDAFVMHPFIFGREMTAFNHDLFSACGVEPSKIFLISEPVVLEHIVVPERLLEINKSAHVRMREIFARIRGALARPVAAERVYLSRSRLPEDRRRISNEAAIETIFESEGFTIVHPQETSIADQVSMYANCRVLAGLSGSALHNVVFCRPQTLLVDIHDTRNPARALRSQVLCNELAGVEYRPVPFTAGGAEDAIDAEAIRGMLRDLRG